MKKKLFLLIFVGSIFLSACGSKETVVEKNTTKEDISTEEATTTEKIESKENLLSVEVTIPKDYFGDQEITQSDIDKTKSEEGFDKATLNEDGSVTYKMSKSKHKEVLDEMKKNIEESCDEMINGEKATESFEKIIFNNDLTKFSVFVDSSKFTDLDTVNSFMFYLFGGYYQLFNCVSDDKIDVQVDYIDSKTEKVLNTGKSSEANKDDEPKSVITESDALNNIKNWYAGIWNHFVDFQAYRESGKDCTGSEIDIDFAYSEFEKEYKSLEEYDNYITNLSDEYSDLKNVWEKMKEQIESIYADISTNGVKKGGERIKLDLLDQYSSSFRDSINKVE